MESVSLTSTLYACRHTIPHSLPTSQNLEWGPPHCTESSPPRGGHTPAWRLRLPGSCIPAPSFVFAAWRQDACPLSQDSSSPLRPTALDTLWQHGNKVLALSHSSSFSDRTEVRYRRSLTGAYGSIQKYLHTNYLCSNHKILFMFSNSIYFINYITQYLKIT